MADYATASRTKDHHKDQLLRDHPEIVSLAPRWKLDDHGMPMGEAVIVIGINSRKWAQLERRGRGPKPLAMPTRLAVVDAVNNQPTGESVDVVIEEQGEAVADSLTGQLRPCPGGASIGNLRGTNGTLGGVVRLPDGSWCGLLGSNHVLASLNFGAKGDEIYQPGPEDGGNRADLIGHLENWIPLKFFGPYNEVDCAMARTLAPCDQLAMRVVYGIGIPAKTATATPHQAIRKCGKATQLTTGVVLSDNATIPMSYGTGVWARFDNLLQYTPMARPGDSGALLWDSDSLTVVGMHVGSHPDTGVGYGSHIDKVLAALGVALV
jgi:hypothetical protein